MTFCLKPFSSQARTKIGNECYLQSYSPLRIKNGDKQLHLKVKTARWLPREKSRTSLTGVPEQVALFCLSFLMYGDLWFAANTCSLFYKAFFTLTKAGGKSGSKRLLNLAHKFPRVKILILHIPPQNLSIMRSIEQEKFPSLRVVRICYICVQHLPIHPGVTALHVIGCEFDASLDFPYPNLQFLRVEKSASEFSAKNALPELLCLRKMMLSWCNVSHKITDRQFPNLRRLMIKGNDAQPNLYIPKLEELILNIPRQLCMQPQVNLRRLKIITDGDLTFLGRISESIYPRLEKLEIDLGIKWQILDLSLLPTHMMLSHLRVASRGRVDVGSLTGDRYPSLIMIDIDADQVDLSQLSGHPNVSHLVVPRGTDTSSIMLQKWPKIKIVENNPYSRLNLCL